MIIMTSLLCAEPTSEKYEILLDFAVCETGVEYEKLIETAHVGEAEQEFQVVTKSLFDSWGEQGQLAWLINLYNFYTIKLIVEQYPLESIRDIDSPWDQKIVPLWGEQISLNDIEHEMIRRNYDEPRIHFAVVCASIGCPSLRLTPFTGEDLIAELDEQAELFLNDETKNRRDESKLYLSKIFQWYGDDFDNHYGNYQNYVKSIYGMDERIRVVFQPYDWNLNVTECK